VQRDYVCDKFEYTCYNTSLTCVGNICVYQQITSTSTLSSLPTFTTNITFPDGSVDNPLPDVPWWVGFVLVPVVFLAALGFYWFKEFVQQRLSASAPGVARNRALVAEPYSPPPTYDDAISVTLSVSDVQGSTIVQEPDESLIDDVSIDNLPVAEAGPSRI
jgi:hypothetical protein